MPLISPSPAAAALPQVTIGFFEVYSQGCIQGTPRCPQGLEGADGISPPASHCPFTHCRQILWALGLAAQPKGRSVRAIGGRDALQRREKLLDGSTAGDCRACVANVFLPRHGHSTGVSPCDPDPAHISFTPPSSGARVSSGGACALYLCHQLPLGLPGSLTPLHPRAFGV